MYWKGMRTFIRSLTKSCKSCQVNKRGSQKYGHLPPKTVYTIPWECLCVNLIGPYILKGKDNLQIDFMALTMINPASSWFKIAELPVIGHGIVGKVSQLKWCDLLKASCWSKRWQSVITRSHSPSTSDGSEIQVHWCHVLYGIPYIGYPLPHQLKYLTSY